MSMSHSPSIDFRRPDLSSERKRQNERKLMEETAEVEYIQESLDKTAALVDQMVTILSSFDDRLRGFETSILPIHKSTQRLNKLYENINKSVGSLQNIIGYFDLASEEEQLILKGPQENNLIPYLTSIGKIIDALKFLTASKFKSGEKAVYQLRQLLNTGLLQLVNLFKKNLSMHSAPIEVMALERAGKTEPPRIPEPALQNLSQLTTYFSNTNAIVNVNCGDGGDIRKVYTDVRSTYLVKSLQPLAISCNLEKDRNRSSAGSSGGYTTGGPPVSKESCQMYQKGSAEFIVYSKWLLRLCKMEFRMIQTIAPSIYLPILEMTVTPALDTYFETGDNILAKVKRSAGRHDFSDVFLLFDVLENLNTIRNDWSEIIGNITKKSGQMQDFISSFTIASMRCFPEFMEEVKSSSIKSAVLASDGTVNELTSNSLNFMKRLLDYQDTVEMMLQSLGENNWHSLSSDVSGSKSSVMIPGRSDSRANIIRKYYLDVLEALNSNLETKSKQYKKSALAHVFLLNNYHYILKSVRSNSKLGSLLGKEIESKYEKLWMKSKEAYMECWKPILEHLMDVTVIQGGNIKTTLSNKERDAIKDKFKNFNTEFEDTYRVQKNITIPDAELRTTVIRDVKSLVLPMYTRFVEKYQATDFTRNPQKYIRFDKTALEGMLGKIFDNSS